MLMYIFCPAKLIKFKTSGVLQILIVMNLVFFANGNIAMIDL